MTTPQCDYCDKQATEVVLVLRKKRHACAPCAAWIRAAEYARKALRGRR